MATSKSAAPAAKKPAVKVPKSLGAVADKLYEIRETRLALDRQSAGLKAEEGVYREALIEKLPSSDATGIVGKLVRATVKVNVVPVADDWSKIYKHIVTEYQRHVKAKDGQEDAAFALLNKALNVSAVSEVWEAKKTIPGVGRFQNKSISLNKV